MRPSPIQGLLVQTCNPIHPRPLRVTDAAVPAGTMGAAADPPQQPTRTVSVSFFGFSCPTVEFKLLSAVRTRAGPGPRGRRGGGWQAEPLVFGLLCWDRPLQARAWSSPLLPPQLCRTAGGGAPGKLSKGLWTLWGMDEEGARGQGRGEKEDPAESEEGEEVLVQGPLQDPRATRNPRTSSQSSFAFGHHGGRGLRIRSSNVLIPERATSVRAPFLVAQAESTLKVTA